ncbi:SIS domain-containing protein [Paenibacillus radicis (ex Gao et al. 2016)]|uniref:Sugar isomerase n=1 Tax=Paenibacillus radicis (ex Gao et al. 2016) TaxID=1737354 RepID=A0A917H0W5_9BACL|nr:SIS domain-containing protein [Paenibacillus radicis (ex Gao et al. 2016)]GGG63970.1 sugar isomerase [Paenibacillus radicis (ex Gao et al. 2016)]
MKPTMMTYILEEQEMVESILASYPDNVRAFADAALDKTDWLAFATGSSYNAALSAKYYIEKWADVRIEVKEPFHFTHYDRLSPYTDLALGISQSGQSTSTIGALQRVRRERDIATIAFASDTESAISETADVTVDIGCGKERVGYVTKGFTGTVLTLMLAGLHLGERKGKATAAEVEQQIAAFRKTAAAIPSIIAATEAFYERYSSEFVSAPRFTAVGSGPVVGTIKEIETKFCETVRMPSQGIELEAFMHGPYLEVNPEHRIFFLETESAVKERLELLRSYESRITPYTYTVKLAASSEGRTLGLGVELDEFQAPLALIIPFQILAHHIAGGRGIDLTNRIYTDFGMAMRSKTQPGDYA